MPGLAAILHGRDLSALKMTAALWGIPLDAPNAKTALPALLDTLHDYELVTEVVEALPADSAAALTALQQAGGRLPADTFTRQFGEIREMGAAQRDRLRPDLNPVSAAERLWYMALIAKEFLADGSGLREFVFIPDEFQLMLQESGDVIHAPAPAAAELIGAPLEEKDLTRILPADDRLLDAATTLLAALRMELDPAAIPTDEWPVSPAQLCALLSAADILSAEGNPQPEPTRAFLELPRADALTLLYDSWLKSPAYSDLRLLPGLTFDGAWTDRPLQTRQAILSLLHTLPANTWWDLSALVAEVKLTAPDFLRSAGEYESWFIRRDVTDLYLSGYAHWNEIEGLWLRQFITVTLHALGRADLAARANSRESDAFRLIAHPRVSPETGKVTVYADGRLEVPRSVPRSLRYQLARFSEWGELRADVFHYRVTAQSLARAKSQGLTAAHLSTLLKRLKDDSVAPAVFRWLQSFEAHGPGARLQSARLLRFQTADQLALFLNTKAARYVDEQLSPTIVTLKVDSADPILRALTEIGLLGQVEAGFDI